MSGRINDLCDVLEDMWCCTIAKEQIEGEDGVYLPNPTVSSIWCQKLKYREGAFHIAQGPISIEIFKRKQELPTSVLPEPVLFG